jgi:hypothetical protein
VTVGDYQGLSYYSDRSVQKLLNMDHMTLELTRQNLLQADLIAFDAPLYQVLSLEAQRSTATQPRRPIQRVESVQENHGPEAISLILRRLRGES